MADYLDLLTPESQAVYGTKKKYLFDLLDEFEKTQRPQLAAKYGMGSSRTEQALAPARKNALDQISLELSDLINKQVSRKQGLEDVASAREYETGATTTAFGRKTWLQDLMNMFQSGEAKKTRAFQGEQAGLERTFQAGESEKGRALTREGWDFQRKLLEEALARQREAVAQAERRGKRDFWQNLGVDILNSPLDWLGGSLIGKGVSGVAGLFGGGDDRDDIDAGYEDYFGY